jgi:hypothetical protein
VNLAGALKDGVRDVHAEEGAPSPSALHLRAMYVRVHNWLASSKPGARQRQALGKWPPSVWAERNYSPCR